jgi:tetratricopeptide (TPR) repeat protein
MLTLKENSAKLVLCLCKEEKESLLLALRSESPDGHTPLTVLDAVANRVDTQNAESSSPLEKLAILKLVEAEGHSLSELNAKIRKELTNQIGVLVLKLGTEMMLSEEKTVKALWGMSCVFFGLGRQMNEVRWYQAALEHLMRLLVLQKASCGMDSIETADTVHKIAECHQQMGKPDSLGHFENSLRISQLHHGEEHVSGARGLVGIASCVLGLKKNAKKNQTKCIEHCTRAITLIQASSEPEEHMDVHAEAWYQIGVAFCNTKDWSESIVHHEKSLELRETQYGKGHLKTAAALTAIATVHWQQGQAEKGLGSGLAMELYLQVLAIQDSVLGPLSEQSGETCGSIAFAYSSKNRLEEAEAFYQRVVDSFTFAHGSEHKETTKARGLLSKMQAKILKQHTSNPFSRYLAMAAGKAGVREPLRKAGVGI